MALTVFYSWQSDLPNKTNRGFIEKALEKAIREVASDLAMVEAERNEKLVLDKDTQGVPGSPPIVDVIFEKISKAAVFVPDLTFIGTLANGRMIPNPNVLIEYGWALKALGHSRIIPVMNAAYGTPTAESLPFDMRHLKHPITYDLTEDAETDRTKSVRVSLATDLTRALRLIANSGLFNDQPRDDYRFEEMPATTTPSIFWKAEEPLGVMQGSTRLKRKSMFPQMSMSF